MQTRVIGEPFFMHVAIWSADLPSNRGHKDLQSRLPVFFNTAPFVPLLPLTVIACGIGHHTARARSTRVTCQS